MLIAQFIVGLLLLVAGAEALVRGASRLAAAAGISPLVIGLTVVAFGTSSPELAVSIKAAGSGQASIALGNVIGSNIFNVLFILGLAALIAPLVVSQRLVRLDVPLMIGLSVLVLLMGSDGTLGRVDGLALFAGLVLYVVFAIRQSRKESAEIREEYRKEFGEKESAGRGRAVNVVLVAGGLAMLVVGSKWVVDAAIFMAQYLGVSELVIALTIVAAGTSLPEVVTSIIATVRGEVDIAVGNVVGSNLFNIMGVLGLSSTIAPEGIGVSPAVLGFDLPIMLVVAFACLPIFLTGGKISRPEGALFVGYYLAYTLYVILAASQHDRLPAFSAVMLYFAIPLTLVTLVVLAAGEIKDRRSRGRPGKRTPERFPPR